MSSFDVHPPEMYGNGAFDDRDAEELLAGGPGDGSPLAAFVAQLRDSATAPVPEVGPELAAVFAVGLTSTEKGDLPVTAASNADGPGFQAAGLPKWRRRRMFSTFLGTLLGKLVVGGVAAAAATGALGAAGALPDPVQSAVSDVVSVVGVDLPHPGEDSDAPGTGQQGTDDHDDDGAGTAPPVATPPADQTGPVAGTAGETEHADDTESDEADDSHDTAEADDHDTDSADEADDSHETDKADDSHDADDADKAGDSDKADGPDDSDKADGDSSHADDSLRAGDDSPDGGDGRVTTAGSGTSGDEVQTEHSDDRDDGGAEHR